MIKYILNLKKSRILKGVRMALKFNKSKGEAVKSKIDSYQYVEGDNVVRMVGDICARYVH